MKASVLLFQRATSAHQAGRFDEAEEAYKGLLKLNGAHADALRLLGALYVQMRRLPEAEETLGKAARIQPGNPEIHNNLGLALRTLGRVKEAASHYEQAIKLKPDYVSAFNNLGNLYEETGRLPQAVQIFQRALALQPQNAKTHYNLANAFRLCGHPADATVHYVQALRLKPDYREAMINLGLAYAEAGAVDRAIDWYKHAMEQRGEDPQVLNNLGNLLRRSGRTDEALQTFDRLIALKPDHVQAYVNQAMVLRDLNRIEEAQALCEKALSLAPNMAAAHLNLGTLCQDRDDHARAMACFDEAMRCDPNLIDATWNKALSELALGDFEQGFADYETGLGQPHLRGVTLTPEKRWDGSPFPGKRLLLWAEQGFGDSLQFIRYAKLCKEKGGEVLVLCPPALRPLLAACPFIDRIAEGITEADYDLHIPLLSLPFAFKTTLQTVPAEVPYLFVSPEARAKWRARFQNEKRLKVGLVWAGNPREQLLHAHMLDRRRSMDLERFLPLLTARADIAFVSLQKGARADQIAALGLQDRIVDFMSDVEDFMDTAAIVENLDLVISVDTSVAHLAGGMGKPVWILSRFDACWRWLRNRSDNPWYPSARVFGQKKAGDWDSVIAEATKALGSL